MKVLTSKIVNGKKMFLIEDNNPQGKVFAQDGKPIKKENISNYNPYYVDVKGLNASESTKTNLTPATKITPQEIKKIKESPTNVGNIKIKEAQEKAQRLKEAEEAYKKRKAGAPITPELLAQETQAIGDKISLQNIPGVGQYIPDILDVTGGLGSMASNLGALPLNLNRGNYGQALLSVAAPLATGALAGIGTQNTGQFVNNIANPLAGVKNPLSKKSINTFKPQFESEINWAKWNKEIPDNPQLMQEYNVIEQTSKANGNWMKNPDGSPFQGTPEQFVQQNSNNFKKAFPEGSNISYRGDLSKISEIKSQQELGKEAIKRKYNLTDDDSEALEKLWSRVKDKLNSGKYTTNEYEAALKYAKGDKNKVLSLYTDIRNPKFTETGESFRVLEKDRQKLLSKGYDALITKPSSFYPEGENVLLKNNQIKSAIGNNGMFDMTNPNIYKTVAGALATGTLGKQAMEKKEFGGKIKILKTKISNGKTLHLIED